MSKIAVIKTGGKQYKVKEGDRLAIEKIGGEIGDKITMDEVLLIADESGSDLQLGKPTLEKAKVVAQIIDQGRAKKITVIKYKAKTRYRRKLGHRQHYTKLLIESIA